MKSYTNTREAPLQKATETLMTKIDEIMNFLQRDRKHTLGQQMLNIVLEMLVCCAMAYDFPNNRTEMLRKYLCYYSALAAILKMCEKKGYLIHKGKNVYVDLIEPLGVSKRQATAWLHNTIKSESANGNVESAS